MFQYKVIEVVFQGYFVSKWSNRYCCLWHLSQVWNLNTPFLELVMKLKGGGRWVSYINSASKKVHIAPVVACTHLDGCHRGVETWVEHEESCYSNQRHHGNEKSRKQTLVGFLAVHGHHSLKRVQLTVLNNLTTLDGIGGSYPNYKGKKWWTA